ncbi:hypothetical protein Syun_022761 [Stephania yunnanensis]|uniref:Zinc knuckle CX2CX4HX4C domain-containing protein n=1 Tax=Stephania yunnanensis TaxID=152371 RepID=A0AAP0F7L0_9MAGN
MHYRNTEAVKQNGDRIGLVVDTDDGYLTKGIEPKKFMRVKVKIPLRAPLIGGLCLKDEEGSTQWVPFKYERLPAFCFYCGCLDYEEACRIIKAKDQTVWIRESCNEGHYPGFTGGNDEPAK